VTHVALPCGIHEALRLLDPCPVCERAAAELERELATVRRDGRAKRQDHVRQANNETARNDMAKIESRYTDEQQADAIRRIDAGESVKAVAKELGCTDSLIYLWRKRACEAADHGTRKAAAKKAPAKGRAQKPTHAAETPHPYTVAAPSRVAHEDVIAFLAALPPLSWPLGDAIRLLAFHAIDGDADDIVQARERIDAYLRARGEVARG